MGVVYSSAELAAGEIPVEGAHLQAACAIMEQVGSLADTELTVVHGSVVNGTSNIRSDLDVLVTYDSTVLSSEPAIVRTINGLLDDIGEETHVKIEPNVWPAHEPVEARRERMYDLLYSRHLARSLDNEQWATGAKDPTILEIAESSYGNTEALKRVALNYVTYKHSGFTKAPRLFSDSDRALSALQRAFEFPKSLGRKVNQLLGVDRELTPQENWEALALGGLDQVTRDALTGLYDLDKEYTGYINNVMASTDPLEQEDIDMYGEWLEKAYGRALNLGIIAASGFANYIASNSLWTETSQA